MDTEYQFGASKESVDQGYKVAKGILEKQIELLEIKSEVSYLAFEGTLGPDEHIEVHRHDPYKPGLPGLSWSKSASIWKICPSLAMDIYGQLYQGHSGIWQTYEPPSPGDVQATINRIREFLDAR